MAAEARAWWRRALDRLLGPAPDAPGSGAAPPPRPKRPRAVRRLDGIAGELDRLQGRYGAPPREGADR